MAVVKDCSGFGLLGLGALLSPKDEESSCGLVNGSYSIPALLKTPLFSPSTTVLGSGNGGTIPETHSSDLGLQA